MRNINTLTGLLALFCIVSSFGGDTKIYTNSSEWLPEDFDTRHTVLLVENFSTGMKGNNNLKKAEDKVNADMKAVMQKLYPYKYEFASADEISGSPKYANTEIYRYVIIDINGIIPAHINSNAASSHNSNPNNPSTYGGGSSNGAVGVGLPVNDLFIYDRLMDESSPPTGHAQGYILPILRTMVNTIVQYLKDLPASSESLPSSNPH